jgi:hypothetical protein
MKTVLVVTQAFGDYAKGDQISDPEKMAAVLEANETHVVRTSVLDDDEVAAELAQAGAAPVADEPPASPKAKASK